MKILTIFLLVVLFTAGCMSSEVLSSSEGVKRTAYVINDSTVVIVSRTTLSMTRYKEVLAATEKRRANRN